MTESSKPGLLIFYDHFYPAYKAGGPIQSLTNLVISLEQEYRISVITSGYDLNDDRLLPGIQTNIWTALLLPRSTIPVNIWYAGLDEPLAAAIKKAIKEINPSVVYLNGMFSYRFVILPLLTVKNTKIAICPRGMLQKGALGGKSFKKKVYLAVLKMSGLAKRVSWHATNEEERSDIMREFGQHSKVIVAGNIPRKPLANISMPEKQPGKLRLVYLSLISEKKNLLPLIKIITGFKENILLDIYGPAKDERYFNKCIEAIRMSAGNITYKGDVSPESVQEIFAKYHASILLTRGENFGHALYESLSAGRPVITSYFTPWNELAERKAGWNVDISNEAGIRMIIRQLADLDQSVYNEFCTGAYSLANIYYKSSFDTSSYKELFS